MLSLCLIVFIVTSIYGDQSELFMKIQNDPSVAIKFPSQRNFLDEIEKPVGHKEQLGRQRPPLGQIPEYFEDPTPSFLWENHVKTYRPAVFRGLLNGSPALTKWTDEYLEKEYGDQEVLVEKKYEDRKTEPKRMTISGFLHNYTEHQWYVVTILPDKMKKDFKTPKPLRCSSMRKNLMELNLWIGTKGTRSMLHYDADNILHCLVSGRKDWMFIHPKHRSRSDMAYVEDGSGSGYSILNVDNIDIFNSSDVGDITWEYTTLYGGDCLYLPPQYMHQVRSYNRSISATFLFYPHVKFDDEDCKNVDFSSYENMENLFVFWGYQKGQETVDMGYRNPFEEKQQMLTIMDIFNFKTLSQTEYFYLLTVFSEDFRALTPIWKETFKEIDSNNDELLQYDEIKTVDIEVFKKICRGTENPHGPTKTFAKTHVNLSNGSAEFNPRPNERYKESKKIYREFYSIFEELEGKRSFTYIKFLEYFPMISNPQEAFVLLDSNMDGQFTLNELKKVPKEKLKKFHSLANPQPQKTESDDEEELNDDIAAMLKTILKLLKEGKIKDEIDLNLFKQLVHQSLLEGENIRINYRFIFKLLDRNHKGYITAEDIKPMFVTKSSNEKTASYEGIKQAYSQDVLHKMRFSKLFSQLTNNMLVIHKKINSRKNEGRNLKDEL